MAAWPTIQNAAVGIELLPVLQSQVVLEEQQRRAFVLHLLEQAWPEPNVLFNAGLVLRQ